MYDQNIIFRNINNGFAEIIIQLSSNQHYYEIPIGT